VGRLIGLCCGWNVCAVSCRFARKHIRVRTWVHSSDVMRQTKWDVEINRTSELLFGWCVHSRTLCFANIALSYQKVPFFTISVQSAKSWFSFYTLVNLS